MLIEVLGFSEILFCYCSLLISKGEYRVRLQNSVFIELLKGQVIQRKHSKEHCFTLTYAAAHTFFFTNLQKTIHI